MSQPKTYVHPSPFRLESGKTLKELRLAYHTYGELNAQKDNVVWVFHALTANSEVFDWWHVLAGEDKPINPEDHYVICVNTLGSIYGSTGPRSKHSLNAHPYGLEFPQFTVRDVVNSQLLLAEALGIEKIKLAIGGSFGGFQALEFAIMYRGELEQLALVVTGAKETAWCIAIHESQRLALTADKSFFGNEDESGQDGMRAARGIGLLTYRTYEAYKLTQSDHDERIDDFSAASYIRYQGEKLVRRFHAHCYWYLTKCLDTHDVGRNRGGLEQALSSIKMPTKVIGIKTDRLVPVAEQKFIASHIPNAEFIEIESEFGHDGFLIEGQQIGNALADFL